MQIMKHQFKVMAPLTVLFSALFVAGCQDMDSSADTNAHQNDAVAVMNTSSQSSNTATNQADNSGQNVVDRNSGTATPMDQGNSASDLDITRQIRQSIVSSTNSYSVLAHNIKIITRDGRVTLRGAVQTDEEKNNIATLARSIAGQDRVNDQLAVKTNP
jgi:osmotically-inducible protein OsmY